MKKRDWTILVIVVFVVLLTAWTGPEDFHGMFPGMQGMFPNAERLIPGFKEAQRP